MYSYSRILYSNEKEDTTCKSNNLDESHKHKTLERNQV